MNAKRQSLGKGLDALLGMESEADLDTLESSDIQSNEGQLRELAVEFLQRGKYQPRRDINAEALEELASSIRTPGCMQPLVVRQVDAKSMKLLPVNAAGGPRSKLVWMWCRLLFVRFPMKRLLPWRLSKISSAKI